MAERFSVIDDTKILGVSDDGMKMVATGEDPKFVISGNWGSLEKIKGFRLTMKYSGCEWNQAYMYWGTDQVPINFKDTRRILLKTDGEEYTYTLTFREGYERKGKLNALRLSIPTTYSGVCELVALEIISDIAGLGK